VVSGGEWLHLHLVTQFHLLHLIRQVRAFFRPRGGLGWTGSGSSRSLPCRVGLQALRGLKFWISQFTPCLTQLLWTGAALSASCFLFLCLDSPQATAVPKQGSRPSGEGGRSYPPPSSILICLLPGMLLLHLRTSPGAFKEEEEGMPN
jgi:hypothetical protein